VACASASAASAVPIQFGGIVTSVDSPLAGSFTVGDLASYTFSIDLAAADGNPSATLGSYLGGPLDLSIGSYTASALSTSIGITDGGSQGHAISFTNSPLSGASIAQSAGARPVFGGVTLTAPGNVLASAALPTTLDLADFDSTTMTLNFNVPGTAELLPVTIELATVETVSAGGGVIYRFEGNVTGVDPALGLEFAVGEAATFSFTVDAAAAADPADNDVTYPSGTFEVAIGDYTTTAAQSQVRVINDNPGGDVISFGASNASVFVGEPVPTDPELRPIYSRIFLAAPPGVFTGDALPESLALGLLDTMEAQLAFAAPLSNEFEIVTIQLTSLLFEPPVPESVPEPSTVWLLIGALAFWAGARRVRRGTLTAARAA
jgi:hypothetical protein